MNWKFWNWKREDKTSNKIEEISQEIKELHKNIDQLMKTNKQMNRLQYKSNQDIKNSINEIEQGIKSHQIDQQTIEQLKCQIEGYQSLLKYDRERIIDLIDEIDLIRKGLDEGDSNWSQILGKWAERLLEVLEMQGVYQLDLLHKEFNPRMAEAISIVKGQDRENKRNEIDRKEGLNDQVDYKSTKYGLKEHEIVEIVKRGYKSKQGELIRKAVVIVYREGENNE